MRLALFLVCLTLGIVCLVAGLFVTRLTWRADVAPFNRRSRTLEIALHPERFATSERLSTIRLLNLIGAVLIVLALTVLAYDIVASVTARK